MPVETDLDVIALTGIVIRKLPLKTYSTYRGPISNLREGESVLSDVDEKGFYRTVTDVSPILAGKYMVTFNYGTGSNCTFHKGYYGLGDTPLAAYNDLVTHQSHLVDPSTL